jgi:hypothetical protein
MTAIVNGIQYIGGGSAPDEFIKNQAATIDGTQTIESAVLAGPITIPATITVTGTLVIV